MRDHEPDYSMFTNLEFVGLFKRIFVIKHTDRISLAQFKDSLGNILNGYRVSPGGGLSKTAPVGNPSPRGQQQSPGMFTSYTPGMANLQPRDPSPRSQQQSPGMFTSYTPGMANPPPRDPSPRGQPQNPGMFTSYSPGMAKSNQQPVSGNNFAPQGGMAQSFAPQGGMAQSFAPQGGMAQSFAPQGGMAQSFAPGGYQPVGGNNFAQQGGMAQSFAPGMGAQKQPGHTMSNSFMPGGENLNLRRGNSFNPDIPLSRDVSYDGRHPTQQQNFMPEPKPDIPPRHLGFQPEGGSLSQMRQRATIYENFQASTSGKKASYNPLEDLFNDRPIQAPPAPTTHLQESNLNSNWVQMEKTSSNLISMNDWENKQNQFQKLRAESEQISQFTSSNFLAKPEDLDDFFSETNSENFELDEEDIDEGPRAKSFMDDRERGLEDRVGEDDVLTDFKDALGPVGGEDGALGVLKDIVRPAEVIFCFRGVKGILGRRNFH
jgi:hypothetical protein